MLRAQPCLKMNPGEFNASPKLCQVGSGVLQEGTRMLRGRKQRGELHLSRAGPVDLHVLLFMVSLVCFKIALVQGSQQCMVISKTKTCLSLLIVSPKYSIQYPASASQVSFRWLKIGIC